MLRSWTTKDVPVSTSTLATCTAGVIVDYRSHFMYLGGGSIVCSWGFGILYLVVCTDHTAVRSKILRGQWLCNHWLCLGSVKRLQRHCYCLVNEDKVVTICWFSFFKKFFFFCSLNWSYRKSAIVFFDAKFIFGGGSLMGGITERDTASTDELQVGRETRVKVSGERINCYKLYLNSRMGNVSWKGFE